MKNFYIVKDEKDLLNGNIIPKKVINYLPGGAFGYPIVRPVPITKSRELVVNAQPTMSPLLSPMSPVMSALSPVVPVVSSFGGPVGFTRTVMPLGAPIIKLGTMARTGEQCKIEIKPESGDSHTINVPCKHVRDVVAFISDESKKANQAPPTAPPQAKTTTNVTIPQFPNKGEIVVDKVDNFPTVGGKLKIKDSLNNVRDLEYTAIDVPNKKFTGVSVPGSTSSTIFSANEDVILNPPAPGAKVYFKVSAPGNPDFYIETNVETVKKIIEAISNKSEWKSITYTDPRGNLYPVSYLLSNFLRRYANLYYGNRYY